MESNEEAWEVRWKEIKKLPTENECGILRGRNCLTVTRIAR